MIKIRKTHSPSFKARVAIEAIKGEKTIAEIASTFSIHSTQINRWKNIVLTEISDVFSDKRIKNDQDQSELISSLYKEIGKQKIEIDFLKKKIGILDS